MGAAVPPRADEPAGSARLQAAVREARDDAAPFALVAAAILVAQALAAKHAGWESLGRPLWWMWLVVAVPYVVLAATLLLGLNRLVRHDHRREIVIGLLTVVWAFNVLGVVVLVASLVAHSATRITGAQLLASGGVVWFTNAIAFGLAFWELDCGGPVARALATGRSQAGLPVPAGREPPARPRRLGSASLGLLLPLADQRDGVQPDRRHAADPNGESVDGSRIHALARHRAPGRRAGSQHPRVARRPAPRLTGRATAILSQDGSPLRLALDRRRCAGRHPRRGLAYGQSADRQGSADRVRASARGRSAARGRRLLGGAGRRVGAHDTQPLVVHDHHRRGSAGARLRFSVRRGYPGKRRIALVVATLTTATLYFVFPLGFISQDSPRLTGLGRFEHEHRLLGIAILLIPTLILLANELRWKQEEAPASEPDRDGLGARIARIPRRRLIGGGILLLALVWTVGTNGPGLVIGFGVAFAVFV